MQSRGAMLRDLEIKLPSGQIVAPLHTAPWVGTAEARTQSGLMQGLSGEWPCVPFGTSIRSLPPQWQVPSGWEDSFAHGFAAHHDWELLPSSDCLDARINLPTEHPISSLERRVRPIENGIGLDLWVNPRHDCRLPIGVHPVFSLADTPEQMQLKVDGAEKIWCHPETPPVDPTPARAGAMSESLEMIKGVDGDLLNFSLLPRSDMSETRLIVTGGTGQVTLTDLKSGVRTLLQYDSAHFPYLMLWISNRGRSEPPWSNRHLALGIEPVRSAFDLGTATSAAANPLSIAGADTAFDLVAGRPLHTTYAISVQ